MYMKCLVSSQWFSVRYKVDLQFKQIARSMTEVIVRTESVCQKGEFL